MDEQKGTTLRELYEDLPCSLVELARLAGLNEVTVARIRDGKPARRSTVNKLLRAMSQIYGRRLSLRNVNGVRLQGQPQATRQQQEKGPPEAQPEAA